MSLALDLREASSAKTVDDRGFTSKAVKLPRSNDTGFGFSGFIALYISIESKAESIR